MGDNLKKNMIGALTWSTVNIGGIQVIQLIIGIILARVLMPEDFGLIGVLYIFIGISTVLIDSGFAQGLIRKQDADNKDFSTVFFFNLFISIVVYIVFFLAAPLIANFFAHDELITLSRVIFISVLLFPFYFIQQVYVLKKLDYKSMAIVNIISVGLSGGLAVFLALTGSGAWALVWQQVTFHLFKVLVYPFFVKWKPEASFSKNTIAGLWKFSLPLLGQHSLNVIFNHVYMVIIGRFYPLKQAGYFAQANKYSETVNAATQNILNYTAFPIFSTIQHDKERSLRIYRKLTGSVAMITFPLVVFLIIAAEPVIITLISEKWLESVLLFQLLLAANFFTPMFTINVSILNAGGESTNTFKLEFIKKVLIVISILGAFSFGISIMLTGFILANFISFLISMFYIKKSLKHYYFHQIKDIFKLMLIVVIIGTLCYFFNFMKSGHLVKLALSATTFGLMYLIAIRIFFHERFFEVKNIIFKKLKIS
jgi:O-antigen/teichoic acid export membrane protein